jgi:3-mercaptopyruvate sulfurtransferase SseA
LINFAMLAVAKRLAAKGFKNVYVMKGGFSAWQKERLPTQLAASVSKVEVVSPGAVLFGSTKRSTSDGSSSSRAIASPTQRRALPSSTEAGRAK